MNRRLLITDAAKSKEKTRKGPVPLPPPELGRDLDTLEKAVWWLSHPSNWIPGRIVLIKWDGIVPLISDYHGQRLIDFPDELDMARSVIPEQRRRKLLGLKKGDEIETNES